MAQRRRPPVNAFVAARTVSSGVSIATSPIWNLRGETGQEVEGQDPPLAA
jgi:hypothetical protein